MKEKAKSLSASITEEISDTIAKMGPKVRARLVERRVEVVASKRVDQLDQAFSKRDEVLKDLKRCKADIRRYDGNGNLVREEWSEEATKRRKELEAKLENIDKAISEALEEGNYDPLIKVIGNPKPSTEAGN